MNYISFDGGFDDINTSLNVPQFNYKVLTCLVANKWQNETTKKKILLAVCTELTVTSEVAH